MSHIQMKKISLDPEKRPPMNFHRGTSNISLHTSTSISGQQNEQKAITFYLLFILTSSENMSY